MPSDKLKDLRERKSTALMGGGKQRIEDQHKKGKLTARERIDLLIDEGTFEEIGRLVQHRSVRFWNGKSEVLGRWCHNGAWQDQWTGSVCVQPGFYRVRRLALGGSC